MNMRWHKATVQFLLVIALLIAGQAVSAQNLKLGVVNIGRLLEEAPQAKAAMKALSDEFAPRQRDIQNQIKQLQDLEERLRRDMAVMGESERRDSERQLRDGQRDIARKQEEFLEDYNLRRNEELASLQRSLMQEVQAYARQGNFDLIVGDGVLFASDSVDVTAQVLAGLEASFQAASENTEN